MNRRTFIRRAAGRGRGPEISCERLYVHYVDAARAGRLDEFLSQLGREVRSAGAFRLADREWLARDDFRAAVGPLLVGR